MLYALKSTYALSRPSHEELPVLRLVCCVVTPCVEFLDSYIKTLYSSQAVEALK